MIKYRKTAWTLLLLIILIIAGELVARWYLGLGDPPLSMTHPRIEYLFKPNQDVMRFGHRIIINAYGMRTAPFPKAKPAGEFRVMVFGDSVLNGGNLSDHANLATTLLSKRLSDALERRVVVGNISAGSWGPGNWLAYAQEYGFFDADVVMLVISSHDYADNPTFETLNPQTHPQAAPWSALWEGVTRYLPRYLPHISAASPAEVQEIPTTVTVAIDRGLSDLRRFLTLAKNSGATVLVAQYPAREEIANGYAEGYQRIKHLVETLGIDVFPLDPGIRAALERGENPYRDDIHPNDLGQALLASASFDVLVGALRQRTNAKGQTITAIGNNRL